MKEYFDIPEYEGYYKVSRCGEVLSCDRMVPDAGKMKPIRQRIMKQHINTHGYPYVRLSKCGKSKILMMHRIIAITFIPNPENKREVNHKNSNRQDFSIDNLEWVTPKENIRHGMLFGNINLNKAIIGIDKHGNKHQFESIAEAFRKTGAAQGNIVNSIKGKRGRVLAGGFKWQYA